MVREVKVNEEPDNEATEPSEFRMYAIDRHGFKVNWTIRAGTTAEELNALISRQGALSQWMQAHEYTPDDFGIGASKPGAPAVARGPVCNDCGGPMEHKTGTGKKGPWSGWFCVNTSNAPRAQQHSPIWDGAK